jgi:SPP1 gp7 family putative phage head morphogenesis protein
MNIINTDAYRTAFSEYLRRGTPIRLSLKQVADTERYVWRTQRDERVRPSHRKNDGRIFSWSNPPDTGHPGEDYNCGCEAVPYLSGSTEFAFFEFSTGLASSYDRWTNLDFVRHYYNGGGRAVGLLEIGHLREIAEQYAYWDGVEGAFRRLADQISDAARKNGPGRLSYSFRGAYDFGDVQFSHGGGKVEGVFSGTVEDLAVMIAIAGECLFNFSNVFADPLGLRIEPGGTPYEIYGEWTAAYSAEVAKDRTRSVYFWQEKQ